MHVLTPQFFTLQPDEVEFLESQENIWNEHVAGSAYEFKHEPEEQWRVLVSRASGGDVEAYEIAQRYGSRENYCEMVKLGETMRTARFHKENARGFIGVRPMLARLKDAAEKELSSYLSAVTNHRVRLGLQASPADDVSSKLLFVIAECERVAALEPTEFERPLSDHLHSIISIEDSENE